MENAFGILASRFRVLQSTMQQEPRVVIWTVTACVVLHNLLRSGREQLQVKNMGLNLDNVLQGNQLSYGGRNPTEAAKPQRNVLADYFGNEGAVPWQMDRI